LSIRYHEIPSKFEMSPSTIEKYAISYTTQFTRCQKSKKTNKQSKTNFISETFSYSYKDSDFELSFICTAIDKRCVVLFLVA